MARNESSPAQPGAVARRRTTLIWWSLAAGSLLAGYADLVRGGETIAPILLVLGYCVLVPLAILRS
ncbi:MAG: hypothetical protein M3303_07890 [Gemmatimonadota bacterium]|nr:hypothetical protein [Gemmatimonadota bacterium]